MRRARTNPVLSRALICGASDAPKHRRLYLALRDAILDGRLAVGGALPSSRTIARELGLSRNTVTTAFEQLVAEEFVESRTGSGTFVLLDQLRPVRDARLSRESGRIAMPSIAPHLSERGRTLASHGVSRLSDRTNSRPFRIGMPALDRFPYALWARIAAHCIKHAPEPLFAYADPAGYGPLRQAIAAYLSTTRAVQCSADQVVVTTGSQQALDLAARLLIDSGDPVWVEDPGYRGAREAFAGNGARLISVPLDESGMNLDAGRHREPHPRLIYVTPSSQFPLGLTMSLERRLSLLAFAKRAQSWIFEDDYDSEFRYVGRPLAALQGLDDGERVIYAGTFSKVIYPGLRLGYIVVPTHVLDAFVAARMVCDRQPPGLTQAIVARFMTEGHFARHVRRMRDLYAERQTVLVASAQRHLDGLLEVKAQAIGMHLVARLREKIDDRKIAARASQIGVDVSPLSGYCFERPSVGGLVIGYTAETPRAIRAGVRLLRRALT